MTLDEALYDGSVCRLFSVYNLAIICYFEYHCNEFLVFPEV